MEPCRRSSGLFEEQPHLQASPSNYKAVMKEPRRSPSVEKMLGRTSFSSVREDDCDLAQTFTASKVSSYNFLSENAIEDSPARSAKELSSPSAARLEDLQWQHISGPGNMAIKSLSNFHGLRAALEGHEESAAGAVPTNPAPLERLPAEVFGLIVRYLVVDIPPNGIDRRNLDLIALLLTSKATHEKTIETVYRHVTIPHSRIFHKFLNQISEKPFHGDWVRRFDFSHFNPASLFSTAKERAAARNLTSERLLQCLELVPNLQEFLAQEYIDDDLSAPVLRKLFLGLERMQAVDLCGCSSVSFKDAFSSVSMWKWPDAVGIRRLSLHMCRILPSSVFETILPKLKNLTHLDVAGTKITNAALNAIPKEASISHLNLAVCRQLSLSGVVKFLAEHPAVRSNLVFLSLATDVKTQEPLEAADVSRVLQILPRTLRSLSLKGSSMESSHIPQLLPLTKYLEELALGCGLKLKDIDRLFAPDPSLSTEKQLAWVPSSLKYLDLTEMRGSELSGLYNHSILLTKATQPLEVVEFSEDVLKSVKKSPGPLTRAGWRLSEVHRRAWLVRIADPKKPRDDGRRPWKMGAQFWGMRKIPVAMVDVGGMYGSFMFGRTL